MSAKGFHEININLFCKRKRRFLSSEKKLRNGVKYYYDRLDRTGRNDNVIQIDESKFGK